MTTREWTREGYEAACIDHAECQGLAPALDALLTAGLPATYEQTGGYCMVVAVYGEQPDYVWITLSESDPADGWLVCHYGTGLDGAEVDETETGEPIFQEVLSDRATTAELAGLVRGAMNRGV